MTDKLQYEAALPPEAPLDMPIQSLRRAKRARRLPWSWRTFFARIIAFGGAIALGTLGSWQLYEAFGNEANYLQYALLGLFALTFYWIAFSTTAALAGMLPARKPKNSPEEAADSKIALVMPVYGEDPAMTGSALLAMSKQLAETATGQRFELFIISDTQNIDAWTAETAAFAILRRESPLPVWYRRRPKNTARKVGNVEDFVKRWGARYEYMVMLDADSIMDAATLTRMAERIDASPRLGLLQTMPRLVGGDSLLARTIQFAGALYGPIVARGVDAWQGQDGNYWGHNAIIRTRAFAESCGLPKLRGRRPIGGHIMSHDFVEAALLRRAGWGVRMDGDLHGSYEGIPPTLGDLAGRERRWAQGNLQHLGVIAAKGLRWPNRVHFLIGIFSYQMSPIWLAMLLVGGLLTAQTLLVPTEYFTSRYQLFPDWPTFDAERMRLLFFAALGLLLLPKFLGLLRGLTIPRVTRSFGGYLALIASFISELFISALYAPLMMLMQTHHVFDIIFGRDSGWATQSRSATIMPWGEAFRRSWLHLLAGWIPLILLIFLAPDQIIWLSPVLAGLCLSPLLTRHSGNTRLGKALARCRILLIPEETHPPAVINEADHYRPLFTEAATLTFAQLINDSSAINAHIESLPTPYGEGRDERLLAITAHAKIDAARDIEQALDYLNRDEIMYIAGHPDSLRYLHTKAEPLSFA